MLDLADHLPSLAAANYAQCRHEKIDYWMQKYPHSRCRVCGQCFIKRDRQRVMVSALARCYMAGYSYRVTAAVVKCNPATVTNWFRRFKAFGKTAKCPCGRERSHGGRCMARRLQRRDLIVKAGS